MTILNVQIGEIGEAGVVPQIIRLETDNTLAEVTATGYLNGLVKQGFALSESDMALVVTKASASSAKEVAWLEVSKSGSNWSLVPSNSPGEVVLPTVANRLPHFTNTTGELSDAAADVVNLGDLTLGASGTEGILNLYPATAAKGSLIVKAVDNTGNTSVTISNAAHGQATVYAIPDVGEAAGSILVNVLDNADTAADIVTFDVTVGQAALASAGSVVLQASAGTKQYKIRQLFLNAGGTNFSGGGGDRLATISDGTSDFSVIPAETLQALANTGWGETGLPFPASVAINVSTAAGADLTIAYSGGSTDYTAGSMVISGVLERVA